METAEVMGDDKLLQAFRGVDDIGTPTQIAAG